MKKLYFLALGLITSVLMAQDTTSFRMVSISANMELDFYFDDSTSMDYVTSPFGANGHAIFMNPGDSMVYALIDATSGDRNLYSINPFTGAVTLIKDFTVTHFNSADVAENGKIYFIEGVAAQDGLIHEYDISSKAISSWKQSSVNGFPRALEYNPIDSSLYIFQGYSTTGYKIDLATKTETSFTTTGLTGPEIHGAYFEENSGNFFLCSYFGEMLTTSAPWTTATQYYDNDTPPGSGNSIMDLTMFRTIRTKDTVAFCPGDSVKLQGIYGAASYQWYNNGTAVPGMNARTVYATAPGTYTALIGVQMSNGTNYMWSEPVLVIQYTSPNFSITNTDNDTLICDGDTIELNGSNGAILQWFMNGDSIQGANSPKYNATMVGSYNMFKTNQNGCSDSASAPYVIYLDDPSVCYQGIADAEETGIEMYPNPVNDVLYIRSGDLINTVEVYNIEGKLMYQSQFEGKTQIDLNFKEFDHGSYYIKVQTADKFISRLIVK
jgi:hypothetical protein